MGMATSLSRRTRPGSSTRSAEPARPRGPANHERTRRKASSVSQETVRPAWATSRASASLLASPRASATRSWSSSIKRSPRRPGGLCSSTRTACRKSPAGPSRSSAATAPTTGVTVAISESSCRSRAPPRLSFRSGSSKKATSPWASCEAARASSAAGSQVATRFSQRRLPRATVRKPSCSSPANGRASSSPCATRRSESAAWPTCAKERTLWSRGIGSSQIGYQRRSATSLTSGRPSYMRTRSRSLSGTSSPRPRLPTATSTRPLSGPSALARSRFARRMPRPAPLLGRAVP